jgi:hypothetical protein
MEHRRRPNDIHLKETMIWNRRHEKNSLLRAPFKLHTQRSRLWLSSNTLPHFAKGVAAADAMINGVPSAAVKCSVLQKFSGFILFEARTIQGQRWTK